MSAFTLVRRHHLAALSIEIEEYRHEVTGAQHFHLATNDAHNAFMVAFRTVPMDSTGVAHILEHTVLCGSEKYPVRDPFFMMIRRSLNTFMNAFTSSDWTAYPFASLNKKDYYNLLDIYLDAVFFPNIHSLDFAQEGHRFDFETPGDSNSPLVYKGVVFNEMKGAMSAPTSALWQAFTAAIFPTSTYHYNSGGDPADIPNLTHEQLVAFHKRHYHPSNAVFFTYGDIPASEHHARWQAQALSRFSERLEPVMVSDEQRYKAPIRVNASYALDEADLSKKTHVVLGWLLGKNQDVRDVLRGHLLSMVLLDNSASPLRYLLETTELGASPSPLCGLQDDFKEMIFAAGLMGSEAEDADAIEALILDELSRLVREGIPHEHLAAMLHQLELGQREIGGDSYPFGLQLFLRALPAAIHGGDPVALLDIDEALLELRQEIANPAFIPQLIQSWLLDNPHRVRLVLSPDNSLNAQKAQTERAHLDATQALMTPEQKQAVVELAAALEERQAQEDDVNILPKVELSDIPAELPQFNGRSEYFHHLKTTLAPAATNGLVYQQVILDIPALTREQADLLPLLTGTWAEVGVGSDDYLSTQMRQASLTGGLSASLSVAAQKDDPAQSRAQVVLSGKALISNTIALAQLMEETLFEARFDELDRLRELVSMTRINAEQSITSNGHTLAMLAASAGFGVSSAFAHANNGLLGLKRFKALDERLENESELEAFAATLASTRDAFANVSRQALIVGESDRLLSMNDHLEQAWQRMGDATQAGQGLMVDLPQRVAGQAWVTSTQVHFCAQAHAAVPWSHADSPLLSVLSGVLRNGYLHPNIREKGGAYGGGASYDAESASFRFFSYRDPRCEETYDIFDGALAWLLSNDAKESLVEEAILGVIGAMDKPSSPASEVKKLFHLGIAGKDHASRMAWRQGVLSANLDSLRRVAQTYLASGAKTRAVLTNEATAQRLAQEQHFEICEV
ncbi:MAG: insulinase family protein [Gammaproteobacteria bacterium]|nr:insulinase family protein [Gammaproteobacteria bacterium]